MCHPIDNLSIQTITYTSTQSKSKTKKKSLIQRWFQSRGTTVVYVTKHRENLFRPRYARYYFVVLFESLVASKTGQQWGGGRGHTSSRNPTIEPLRGPVIGLLEITMGAPSVVFMVFVFVLVKISLAMMTRDLEKVTT